MSVDPYADIRGKYAPYEYPSDVLICESTGEPLLPDRPMDAGMWVAAAVGALSPPALIGISWLINFLSRGAA